MGCGASKSDSPDGGGGRTASAPVKVVAPTADAVEELSDMGNRIVEGTAEEETAAGTPRVQVHKPSVTFAANITDEQGGRGLP